MQSAASLLNGNSGATTRPKDSISTSARWKKFLRSLKSRKKGVPKTNLTTGRSIVITCQDSIVAGDEQTAV